MIRFVVTHVSAKSGLRVLTFAAQGRYTYDTRAEAARQMELCREGLRRVIGDAISTLQVREVECYPDHYDPKKTVFDEVEQ